MKIKNIPDDVEDALILGLSSSGTTILNSILNSCKNGFSLCEPYWKIWNPLEEKVKDEEVKLTLDKLGKFKLSINQVKKIVEKQLSKNKWEFGAVKETVYRDDKHKVNLTKEILESDQYDLYIFNHREPGLLLDTRAAHDNNSKLFVRVAKSITYLEGLRDALKNTDSYVIDVKHEKLCLDGLSYFNKKLPLSMKIEGPLNIKEENFDYGNQEAKDSSELRDPRTNLRNISTKWRKKINHNMDDTFLSYKIDDDCD